VLSELETLLAHARMMAESKHAVDCPRAKGVTVLNCGNEDEHEPHEWAPVITYGKAQPITGRPRHCFGICFGCLSDQDRADWKRVADEVGAYLAPDDEQGSLM
jgi:hypothetical protein